MNKILALITWIVMMTITIVYCNRKYDEHQNRKPPICLTMQDQTFCEWDERYSDYRVCNLNMEPKEFFLVPPFMMEDFKILKYSEMKRYFSVQFKWTRISMCTLALHFDFINDAK